MNIKILFFSFSIFNICTGTCIYYNFAFDKWKSASGQRSGSNLLTWEDVEKEAKLVVQLQKNAFTEGRKIKSNYGVTKKLESYLSSCTV